MVEVTPENRRLALPKITSGKGSVGSVVMLSSVPYIYFKLHTNKAHSRPYRAARRFSHRTRSPTEVTGGSHRLHFGQPGRQHSFGAQLDDTLQALFEDLSRGE